VRLDVQLQFALEFKKFAAKIARHLVVPLFTFLQRFRGSYVFRNLCGSTFEIEQLFFREALHPHLQFPPSVDAAAQVPLQLHLGGIQFVAHWALVIICFPVSSETGNWMSVEES
jgi:hypothetical protein